jgi:hypothetical protein
MSEPPRVLLQVSSCAVILLTVFGYALFVQPSKKQQCIAVARPDCNRPGNGPCLGDAGAPIPLLVATPQLSSSYKWLVDATALRNDVAIAVSLRMLRQSFGGDGCVRWSP